MMVMEEDSHRRNNMFEEITLVNIDVLNLLGENK